MTYYPVGGQQPRYAIHSTISTMDIDKQDKNYIIDSTIKISDEILESLTSSKTTEPEQTENPKQDAGREIDTNAYPFIQLEADEREHTTITLYDYENANELNSTPISLLYLLEYHALVNSMNESNILECCLTAEYYRRILEIYKNNPDPLFCHNCGQRFKYVSQNQLAYKHQNNQADILRTLKLKTETQPTFDPAETNQ